MNEDDGWGEQDADGWDLEPQDPNDEIMSPL